MAAFPAGYTMVPSGMGGYTMQPGYNTLNYQASMPQPPQPNGYSMGMAMAQPPQQPAQMPIIQPQQVGQPMVIGGKMVDSLDVVRATDIPMDSATYYFPNPNGQEIYTKRWNTDGSAEIVIYKRELEPPSEETKQFMDGFLCKEDVVRMQTDLSQKLDSILERVSKLEEAFK